MEQNLWKALQERSVQVVMEVLLMPEPTRTDLKKAALATSALASYTRHEATESSRERTAVVAARMLTQDERSFRAYLAAAAPRLVPSMLSDGGPKGDNRS